LDFACTTDFDEAPFLVVARYELDFRFVLRFAVLLAQIVVL
jgi:hypothetical protein